VQHALDHRSLLVVPELDHGGEAHAEHGGQDRLADLKQLRTAFNAHFNDELKHVWIEFTDRLVFEPKVSHRILRFLGLEGVERSEACF